MAGSSSRLELVITASATAALDALEKVHSTVDRVAKRIDAMGRLRGVFGSIGQGILQGFGIAGFLQLQTVVDRLIRTIPDLIEKGVQFGEKVNLVSMLTGGTAEQASRLLGTYQLLGMSTENVGAQFVKLAKNLQSGKVDLSALDEETRHTILTSNNLITVVDAARHGFNQLADGAEKTRLQAQLFGKGAAEVTEFLSLQDSQIKALNATLDDLGVTITEEGVARAEALGKTMNLVGLSIQGLANRLLADVAPVIEGFVVKIASWVKQHSADIAGFLANAINWIIGFADALFGLDIPLINVQDILTGMTAVQRNFTDSTESSTDAVRDQTAALQEKDKLSELAYAREKRRLDAVLQSQLDSLDAAERARDAARSQLELEQRLSDAQAELAKAKAGGDPSAVASAADRVREVYESLADAQFKAQQASRKADIEKVKDYLGDLDKLVSESVNRQALAKNLATRRSSLEAQVAAAKETGDAQKAADLTTMLEGVKAAEKRTKQKSASEVAIAALEAERQKVGDVATGARGLGNLFDGIATKMPTLGSAMAQAMQDGKDAAETLKKQLGGVADVLKSAAGAAESLAGFFSSIPDLPAPARLAIGAAIAGVGATHGNIPLILAGLTLAGISVGDMVPTTPSTTPDSYRQYAARESAGGRTPMTYNEWSVSQTPRSSSRAGGLAAGGPARPYGTYLVGEAGPELLSMGGSGGWVTPLGGGGGGQSVVVHTAINLDGQRVADVVDRHLFNSSRIWQGVAGGSVY